MASFSGGEVGVKHRPTASNLKTLPYKIRATVHHSNLLEKKNLNCLYKSIERIPKINLAGTKISKMKSNRTCIR